MPHLFGIEGVIWAQSVADFSYYLFQSSVFSNEKKQYLVYNLDICKKVQ